MLVNRDAGENRVISLYSNAGVFEWLQASEMDDSDWPPEDEAEECGSYQPSTPVAAAFPVDIANPFAEG